MKFALESKEDFGLPIDEGILGIDDPNPWKITPVSDGIKVSTKYFGIKIHVGSDGKSSQLELDSRPAFELALLSLVDNEPHVALIKKQRAEQQEFRDVDTIMKVPGGYFHDGSGGNLNFVRQRLVQETGLKVDLESVCFFGVVIGHTEIRTPIILGYATRFKKVQEPRVGVQVITVPLSEALQMAENAVRRVSGKPFLENDTAFEGLFTICRMLERGEITISA